MAQCLPVTGHWKLVCGRTVLAADLEERQKQNRSEDCDSQLNFVIPKRKKLVSEINTGAERAFVLVRCTHAHTGRFVYKSLKKFYS